MSVFVMWALWFILILEYVYIFLFPLNYDLAFMNSELWARYGWILGNGLQWRWEDFGRALNVEVLELDGSRLSRPISDLLTIVEAKFRANCWNYITPHPSLSIFWPLALFGTPIALYKFFRNYGCRSQVAFLGSCLYLSSPGFLVNVTMLFHPAKVLINLLAVWVLWIGSHLYKKSMAVKAGAFVKEIPRYWAYYLVFLFSIFISFFVDETGLFLFVIAAILFYPIFFRFKEYPFFLGVFLLLPVGYFLVIRYFLPYLHSAVRGNTVSLFTYGAVPGLSEVFSVECWKNHLTNIRWLLCDHPHMQLNTADLLPNNPALFLLQVVYTLVMVFIIVLFVLALLKRQTSQGEEPQNRRTDIRNIITSGILLIAYSFFHTLHQAGFAYTWGVWYYGSLYSLVYLLLLIFIIQFIINSKIGRFLKRSFVFVAFVIILHGLIFLIYRVDKFYGVRNPSGTKEEIFGWKLGPYYKNFSFIKSLQRSQCKRFATSVIWAKAKKKNVDFVAFSKMDYCEEILREDNPFNHQEINYLLVELFHKTPKLPK